jgi:hypothetical protein
MARSVQSAHKEILGRAAEIANQDPRVPFQGSPFREAEVKSTKGGLCLDYDEGLLILSPEEERERVQEVMTRIGTDAILQALSEKKDLFVGLILGEARKGRNYFDRF